MDKKSEYPAVPPDVKRHLTIAHIDKDESLRQIGLVGDTYTVTIAGGCNRRTILGDRHAHPARRRPASTPA